ncbi:MAG: phospholipid carrier-dependent glycosyltransferase [Candidatus Omnitrophica bacterium]|nr:phospholipid carrier-dependent glycosyltransferase [Candidatus Omnitrophota bacterium]
MQNNNFFGKYHFKIFFILILLSLFTRLINLSFVNRVIFDEVHYGKYITGYLKHEYFFDDHPPLAKLFMAGLAKLSGLNPKTSFEYIGLIYPQGTPIFALRFIPALFGSLLIPLIFLFTEKITQSIRTGLIASILLLFDNAFLAHSRFISPDTFLIFFIIFTIYSYLKSERGKNKFWLLLSGISAGFSLSTKWIGLIGQGLVFFSILFYEHFELIKSPKKIIEYLFTFVLLPFFIYYFAFAIHFRILHHSAGFKEFIGLNFSMLYSHSRHLTHHYSSKWFTWPLMIRPVSYLHSSLGNNQVQNITFLGNPFVWWLSTLGLITFILLITFKKILSTKFKNIPPLPGKGTVLLGYLIAYLPFISISRCMFLYHYLTALIFAIIATAILLDKFLLPPEKEIPSPSPSIITLIAGLPLIILISRAVYLWYIPKEFLFLIGSFFILLGSLFSLYLYFITKRNIYKIPNLWLIALFFTLIGCFLIFSPLSYGIPIKQKTFDFYMWIKSWI